MRIRDVMTTEVECVNPDATMQEAAERMKTLNVGSLPVCENDNLIGIVTDRDLTIRGTASACDPADTCVRDVMTPHLVYCFDDQDVADAAQLMEEKQIRRIAVLDRSKRLVGIFSLGDLAVKSDDEDLSAEALRQVSEPALPTR